MNTSGTGTCFVTELKYTIPGTDITIIKEKFSKIANLKKNYRYAISLFSNTESGCNPGNTVIVILKLLS